MQGGQLNQWVRVERQDSARDSFTPAGWELLEDTWASVQPVRSAEQRLADTQRASLTHTVLVRWSAALAVPLASSQWRITFSDLRSGAARKLAVVGPARDLQHAGQWLIFDCVEGLADGH